LLWDEDLGILRFQSVLEDRYGLDLGDWTLHSANAISGDGLTLAGYGTNPSGLREAWVARITDTIPAIPEPTTGLLTLLGLEPACLDRILPSEKLEKHSKSPSLCGTKESPNTFNHTERAISSE
jgi:hypothetical protein